MTDFHAGQKVVCINESDNWWPSQWRHLVPNRPVKNGIYTVRAVVEGEGSQKGKLSLWLVEISNVPIYWEFNGESGTKEPSFAKEAFRPLVERKTDISIFKKMLNPSKIHENS